MGVDAGTADLFPNNVSMSAALETQAARRKSSDTSKGSSGSMAELLPDEFNITGSPTRSHGHNHRHHHGGSHIRFHHLRHPHAHGPSENATAFGKSEHVVLLLDNDTQASAGLGAASKQGGMEPNTRDRDHHSHNRTRGVVSSSFV